MSPALDLSALIEASDLDALIIAVDHLCADEEWDELVALEQRCHGAVHRGRQLWPVASHIQYRMALSAPARYAAGVIVPGAGRFALGPLPEVAASTHSWAELSPSLPAASGPLAAICAHERVVRGEDLTGLPGIDRNVLEVPLRLEPWEPSYPVATYHPDRAEFPPPDDLPPAAAPVQPPPIASVRRADEPDAVRSLLDLAGTWTRESDGRAEAVAVRGDAAAALGGLGVPRARVVALEPAQALALMAWTAASGGAHGRRRGMAPGRFGAWWTVAALAGALDDWPLAPAALGDLAAGLRWYRWDAGDPETGWACRIAVEDPDAGLAWALAAADAA